MTSVAGPPYPPAARRLGPRAHDRSRELWVRKTGSCRRYPSRRPANRAASRRVISGHFRCRGSDKFKLGLVHACAGLNTPNTHKRRRTKTSEAPPHPHSRPFVVAFFGLRVSGFGFLSAFGLRVSHHWAVQPPSISKSVPVIKPADSEQRYTAICPTSSACPQRPRGIFETNC